MRLCEDGDYCKSLIVGAQPLCSREDGLLNGTIVCCGGEVRYALLPSSLRHRK